MGQFVNEALSNQTKKSNVKSLNKQTTPLIDFDSKDIQQSISTNKLLNDAASKNHVLLENQTEEDQEQSQEDTPEKEEQSSSNNVNNNYLFQIKNIEKIIDSRAHRIVRT